MPRKIIGEFFIDAAGISDNTFWKYVTLIRKANKMQPKKHLPKYI